jgi:hypothetical protein
VPSTGVQGRGSSHVIVHELIEEHLLDDDREAALTWLDNRVDAYACYRPANL